MTQDDRIRVNQAARTAHTVYLGKSFDGIQYVVDDRDALPPDIIGGSFNIGQLDCSGTALVAAIENTEAQGTAVCFQVGDVYYETA